MTYAKFPKMIELLPSEIIPHIVRGWPDTDIMVLSRVCSYLRQLILSVNFWLNLFILMNIELPHENFYTIYALRSLYRQHLRQLPTKIIYWDYGPGGPAIIGMNVDSYNDHEYLVNNANIVDVVIHRKSNGPTALIILTTTTICNVVDGQIVHTTILPEKITLNSDRPRAYLSNSCLGQPEYLCHYYDESGQVYYYQGEITQPTLNYRRPTLPMQTGKCIIMRDGLTIFSFQDTIKLYHPATKLHKFSLENGQYTQEIDWNYTTVPIGPVRDFFVVHRSKTIDYSTINGYWRSFSLNSGQDYVISDQIWWNLAKINGRFTGITPTGQLISPMKLPEHISKRYDVDILPNCRYAAILVLTLHSRY